MVPQPGCPQLSGGMLFDLGVNPESLAAVGATDAEVRAIVVAAQAFCEANATELSHAAQRREELAGIVQALEDRVRDGTATRQEREALVQARGEIIDEADAQDFRLDTLRMALASTLGSDQREWIAHIRAARAVEAPAPLKVIARSDAEWVALRSPESRAEAESEAVEVAVAITLYNARRDGVAAAWREAMR